MKRLFATFCLAVCTVIAMAQMKEIQGTVTSDDGPVVGATVVVKGLKTGTTTDIDGHYSIKAPKNSLLVFSFVGYDTVERKVSDSQTIDVMFTTSNNDLNEIVVTALGIKRNKKSLGYSSQQVGSDALNVGNDVNMLNKLTGKIAGVQVTAGTSGAGSSSRVVIRGESSFSNDNQPLYVVDGVPINNSTYSAVAGTSQEIDYGNGAGEINADDIQSINVLKGANATALYGSRAANGVILITTKSGKTRNKFQINVNSTTTFETVSRLPKYQNSYSQGLNGVFEYWDGNNGKGTQDQQDMSWGRPLDGSLVAQFDSPSTLPDGTVVRGGDVLARNGASITPTPLIAHPDNVRDFFKTGVTYNNNVALSAHNDKGDMRLSYTNLYSTGAIPNVNLKRHTVNVSTSYQFSDRFMGKATVSYINSSSSNRSEERRVGKECRSRWSPYH